MNYRRVFISGRVVAETKDIDTTASDQWRVFIVSVTDDGLSQLWAILLKTNDKITDRIADGDVIAAIGLVDADRKKDINLSGIVKVEAFIAMNHDGDFLGSLDH